MSLQTISEVQYLALCLSRRFVKQYTLKLVAAAKFDKKLNVFSCRILDRTQWAIRPLPHITYYTIIRDTVHIDYLIFDLGDVECAPLVFFFLPTRMFVGAVAIACALILP